MYAIYLIKNGDIQNGKRLVHGPNAGDDGSIVTSGKLNYGVNIAGNLSATIPTTNPVWRVPIKLPSGDTDVTLVAPLDQGDLLTVETINHGVAKEIWRGRIASFTWDIYKNMSVNCEGILSYFNDLLLPEYNFYWSGVLSQAYDPDEGLGSVDLSKLKDLIPGIGDNGIGGIFDGVVQNVLPSDTFTPDLSSISQTMSNALSGTNLDEDDNVDRRVTVYDYLVWVLTIYNAQLTTSNIDKLKQIKIGYIDPIFNTDEYKINKKTTQYTVIWEEIQSVVLDVFGGYLYLSHWHQNESGETVYDDTNTYLYYYKDSIGTNSQIIQYGENLLEYEYEEDSASRVNRWYIFGKTKDTNGKEIVIDMSSVNNGLKYVEVPSMFIGTIARAEYTNLTTPKELYDYGMKKLADNFFAAYKITVNAVDLHLTDSEIAEFEPGKKTTVLISNELYNVKSDDYVLETIDLDLLSPENSTYTFVNTGTTPGGG